MLFIIFVCRKIKKNINLKKQLKERHDYDKSIKKLENELNIIKEKKNNNTIA